MRLLLIHQNFPGQFRDLAPGLLDRGHELKAIGCNERPTDSRIQVIRYGWSKHEVCGAHSLIPEMDEWVRRGEAVARICAQLKQQQWAPDVILVHPGWGESLFLQEVFDAVPIVIWPELWLRPEHFGKREGEELSLEQRMYQRSKNWVTETALAQCSLAILPTHYQAQTFPARWQSKIQVIHEGVREHLTRLPRIDNLSLGQNIDLTSKLEVVTFAARNLEPMRGYGQFLEALAVAQQQMPKLHAVIAGGNGSSYSGSSPLEGKSWKEVMESNMKGELDYSRVHHVGNLSHDDLIKLFRRSDTHCYLSRSFVLSWSVLEAMACGTTIVADDNRMLQELGGFGGNVLFCNSKDPESLANTVRDAIIQRKSTKRAEIRLADHLLSSSCAGRCERALRQIATKNF